MTTRLVKSIWSRLRRWFSGLAIHEATLGLREEPPPIQAQERDAPRESRRIRVRLQVEGDDDVGPEEHFRKLYRYTDAVDDVRQQLSRAPNDSLAQGWLDGTWADLPMVRRCLAQEILHRPDLESLHDEIEVFLEKPFDFYDQGAT